MSGTFRPKFAVLSDARKSILNVIQTLRRVPFVIADTFSFGDWDITVDWSTAGDTTTAGGLETKFIKRARYIKIWNMLWVSVDIGATLRAPFGELVTFTLPYTLTGYQSATTGVNDDRQGMGCFVENAAVPEAGNAFARSGTNIVRVERYGAGLFTAGAARVCLNGFFEVRVDE